jgi:hypothetical protein
MALRPLEKIKIGGAVLAGCSLALFLGFFLLCLCGWGLGRLLQRLGVTG